MLIYMFINKVNGKKYVGLTSRSLEERTAEHLRHDATLFDKKLREYGITNFDLIVLDVADTLEELNEKEKYYIKLFKTLVPNGYNLCEGGGVTKGYKHREESKQKMSESRKQKDISGENNPFYGNHHTEEARKKMRKAWTEERRKKLSEESKNRKHSTKKVKNIDTGEIFDSIKAASEKYNVKATHITRVCKGKRKKTGGYRWEYVA